MLGNAGGEDVCIKSEAGVICGKVTLGVWTAQKAPSLPIDNRRTGVSHSRMVFGASPKFAATFLRDWPLCVDRDLAIGGG